MRNEQKDSAEKKSSYIINNLSDELYRILTSPYVGGVKIQTTCKNIQQYHKPKRLVRYIYCNGSKVSWTATGLLHRSGREESEHKSLHSGLIEKYLLSAL